jgi:hypothetical protein
MSDNIWEMHVINWDLYDTIWDYYEKNWDTYVNLWDMHQSFGISTHKMCGYRSCFGIGRGNHKRNKPFGLFGSFVIILLYNVRTCVNVLLRPFMSFVSYNAVFKAIVCRHLPLRDSSVYPPVLSCLSFFTNVYSTSTLFCSAPQQLPSRKHLLPSHLRHVSYLTCRLAPIIASYSYQPSTLASSVPPLSSIPFGLSYPS